MRDRIFWRFGWFFDTECYSIITLNPYVSLTLTLTLTADSVVFKIFYWKSDWFFKKT